MRTLAEQVEGLTAAHARLTVGLRGLLTQVGLALAGRAGSRLASLIGVGAGRDTLLRLVKALPDPPQVPITVLGVDDFAFRRGRHYGTILIDMATHRPVKLFDGRDGDSLTDCLRAHPGVEVICQDRAGGYGEGARAGAPDAAQVADRFHLWQNLGQAIEKTVNQLRARLIAPVVPPVDDSMPAEVQPQQQLKIVTRLREHHAAVHELAAQGWNKSAIGRKLGLHQATVRKYLNRATAAELTAVSDAGVPAVLTRRIVLGIPEVVGDLTVHRSLNHPFGQLTQQTNRTGQLQTRGTVLLHQRPTLGIHTLQRDCRVLLLGHRGSIHGLRRHSHPVSP